MDTDRHAPQTILVLAPRGRDAAVIAQVLDPLGLRIAICDTLDDLASQLDDHAAVAVLTEETLREPGAGKLHDWVGGQPQWSDFPFVVLATKQVGSRSGQASAILAKLGNEVLLERPLNAETLLSSVNSALRSRRRQYETRTHLEKQASFSAENRRLYEAERTARADAEAANVAKDEFLATLSHELRTPLSAILGWTYVLQQRRDDLGDLARGVDTIERNARAQARLIEDLLDMSRIVAGKVNLELETLVPANLIEQVIASVQPSLHAKKIVIERSLVGAMIPILGDPQRLQQVLWNLLTNAIKFTGDGGRISIDSAVKDGDMVLSITDSGVGIEPGFLPLVFERFRQADGTTTRAHGGLGLGLAIVRRLVELHGGSITAFSAGLGEGSTFTLKLPLAEQPPAERDPGSALLQSGLVEGKASTLRDVRVLLVEDDKDSSEIVSHLLVDSGAQVQAVESAEGALGALSLGRFDVLVSDIGMPGVDGYEMLRRIRSSGNVIPAIALTAFARTEDRAKALEAGYTKHLSKPVEPPELISAVAAVRKSPPR